MTTVAIIFGGCSSEYEVSLQSAVSVAQNLDESQFYPVLVGITREGAWYRFDGSLQNILDDIWEETGPCRPAVLSPCRRNRGLLVYQPDGSVVTQEIDVVFPVLHGKNGEDGTMQGLLQLSGIPYVGCDAMSSALCMDKEYAHTVAEAAGISVPKSIVIRDSDSVREKLLLAEEMGYPLFVKPAKAGSSIGISKAYTGEQLLSGVVDAFTHDDKVVIEQCVSGFEVGCAVLGNGELTIGEVDQISLQGGFFDYHEKYTLEHSQICLPAALDASVREEIKETALKLYRLMGCKGFARVDLFYTRDGRIVFNEINTIPGFTSHSRYPSMLGAAGVPFDEIISRLINLALERSRLDEIHTR